MTRAYSETERRNLDVVRQMFGEVEGPADKTELFADDAVWWNGLPMIPNAVGQTEHRGIEAIRNILPSGGVKKHAPGVDVYDMSTGRAEDMAELRERAPEGGFTDEGVSLHVRSAEDGHEFVRFDVFDGEPHYHYVRPTGDHNNVVSFDPVADGEMLPWALDRLRNRLGDMLTEAGGGDLAPRLDGALLGKVVDEVGALAAEAQRSQRAARGVT